MYIVPPFNQSTQDYLRDNPTRCDVCGDKAFGLASSRLGAVSFNYCKRCISSGAEPYNIVVSTIWSVGGLDNLADWGKKVIDDSLSVVNKTKEDLLNDVAELEKQFQEDMANYTPSDEDDFGGF